MKIGCSFLFNCSSKNNEKSRHFYFVPLLVILQISFMPAEPMAGMFLKYASFSWMSDIIYRNVKFFLNYSLLLLVARYSSPALQLMPPNTQSFGSFNNSPTMPNLQSSIQREYSLKRNELPQIIPFSVLVRFWAKHKLTPDQRGRIKNYKGIIKKFTRQIKRSPNINPSEEDDDLLKIKEISRLLVS